jgi:hypothetical protein
MTLGNMRQQGAHHLIAFCSNDSSRRAAGQPELALLINALQRNRTRRGSGADPDMSWMMHISKD